MCRRSSVWLKKHFQVRFWMILSNLYLLITLLSSKVVLQNSKLSMVAGYRPACRNMKLQESIANYTFCGFKRKPFFSDLLPWSPRRDPSKLLNKDICVFISFQFQQNVASNFTFVELDCSTKAAFVFEA